jgi:hypothetical protein
MTEDKIPQSSRKKVIGLAIVLWAATSILAFLEILTVRAMVIRIYERIWGDYRFIRSTMVADSVGIGAVFVMGLASLVMIIGTGEFHLKYYGQSKSWQLFTRTIAVEVSILVLALYI